MEKINIINEVWILINGIKLILGPTYFPPTEILKKT